LVINSYFKAKEERVKTRGIENTIGLVLFYPTHRRAAYLPIKKMKRGQKSPNKRK
jgi:hypothetical protein